MNNFMASVYMIPISFQNSTTSYHLEEVFFCLSRTFGLSVQHHVAVAAGAPQAVVGLHSHSLGHLVPVKAVRGGRLDPHCCHGAAGVPVLDLKSIHTV